MTSNHQFVISLNRLTLPPQTPAQKIILSVFQPPNEYFIQNQRIVKAQKINFYRQNLFISLAGEGLSFIIYEMDARGGKNRLITLNVEKSDLLKFERKPMAFKTERQGFILAWDGWIFTQDSSQLNEESQRDYTQLDLPFQNETPNLSRILVNSHSQNCRFITKSRITNSSKRRSSSTDETSSHGSKDLQSRDENMKSNVTAQDNSLLKQPKLSQMTSAEKRKPNIKSQLYSSIVAGISGLLSQKKPS